MKDAASLAKYKTVSAISVFVPNLPSGMLLVACSTNFDFPPVKFKSVFQTDIKQPIWVAHSILYNLGQNFVKILFLKIKHSQTTCLLRLNQMLYYAVSVIPLQHRSCSVCMSFVRLDHLNG